MMGNVQDAPLGSAAENTNAPPTKDDPIVNWKARLEAAKRNRDEFVKIWKVNTRFRKGKPFTAVSTEEDAVNVPVDWSRTKNKTAQLFFQVPTINLEAQQPQYQGATAVAGAALNEVLRREVKAHVFMDECLADVINASGIAVACVGYDQQFEYVQQPQFTPDQLQPQPIGPPDPMDPTGQPTMALPPEIQSALDANGGEVPMQTVPLPVYQCYYTRRISPGQFLWPADFVGTDWQTAEWLGYDGRMPLAEAIRRKWVNADFEETNPDDVETTSDESDDEKHDAVGKYITFQHVYFRKSTVDPMTSDPRKIGHLVYVKGKDEPAVTEDFAWQKYDTTTRDWIGMTSFPLKVMTLTTLSDEAVPPSDSEIGRPQVKELMRSRSQMIKQRDRSLPVRWFDVNQVDEDIAEQLRKGVYQDMIPMNGSGSNAIGEVARANYPREAWEFMNVIRQDLDEAWSMGRNQQGLDTPGETSATESQIVAQSSNVRIDYERAKVLRFFLECAEGVFELMQMFQDDQAWAKLVGPDGMQSLQAWDRNTIRGDYAFNAHPDSAVKLDASQQKTDALNMYKLTRQDPLLDPKPIITKVLEAHGIDPSKTFAPPPPPPPPPPAKLSFSFAGADLANPMAVALIQKHGGIEITPADIEAAKALMLDAKIPQIPPTEMDLPKPGDPGQPEPMEPTLGGVQPGSEAGPQPNPGHPGPAAEVTPLNQRYEKGGENRVHPV